ncbi:hypothetical protein PTSG_03262 [Salpingoeca rosetta]|uniref:Phospholipid/glycerol acyltransferase domain-containing protein n=1 Tax=Salpingoeca rosetta (strain ATCC 50818 / BSB-021) TaxID=946362 RepID=F2U4P1_SALR5|nr:uncharacterized protein PTSG_03262 [Salpingoeca rosetta]EGD82607.1 hypothetical protein PTSG_03262 [Salpingoeca rosetta]|eukprot:XP_004995843.1 hypothetical protein PTSG_03262 [Salpingoeca rosetta]
MMRNSSSRDGGGGGDSSRAGPPELRLRPFPVRSIRPRPLWEHALTGACAVGLFAAFPVFTSAFNIAVFSGLGLVSKPLLRAAGNAIRASFYRHVLIFVRDVGGTKFTLYGDLPGDENQLCICNHQSDVDWLTITAALRPANCDGRCAFILKNTLKYVPMFGWFWWMSGFVYVRKSWQKDEPRIKRKLTEIAESGQNYSLIIFPEGTRYTPQKAKESLAFAHSRGLPETQHVLTPRSKGFIAAVQSLGTSLDSVYDMTIAYTSATGSYVRPEPPTLFGTVGREYNHVHIHVRRHRAADLPHNAADIDAWLRKRFEEKEALMQRFHQGYGFDGPQYELCERPWTLAGQMLLAASSIAFLFATKTGRRVLTAELVLSGVVLTTAGVVFL